MPRPDLAAWSSSNPHRRSKPGVLATLLVFLSLLLRPVSALAETPTEKEVGFEQRVDAAVGVVVDAMASVLFFPLLASEESAASDEVADEVADVLALRDAITAKGYSVESANLTLQLPAARVSEAEAEGLRVELQPELVPGAPIGLKVERVADESFTGTRLVASQGGIPVIVLWLLCGAVFFTLRMGFINIRAFRHAIRVTRGDYDNPADEGEVSHFQALASALSATVGLGNIAGVAIAVGMGGPGAVFWIIVAGLLGMSSKFTECTLALMYRERRPDGRVLGGPMTYLSKGIGELGWPKAGKALAILFAVLCVGGSFGGGSSFQVNQSLGILRTQIPVFDDHPWVYGLIMSLLVGIVILGGIKRIAATAEKIVPLMCGIYVVACLFILFNNAAAIPSAFGRIVGEAFTPAAGLGGFIGVLVIGIKRAVFSNEAGVGSAPIAHSAAKTEYPVREGIVALLEPFIDTVVVCTMTGLVIVITGAFEAPANYGMIASADGAALTAKAMGGEISWFPWVLTVAVVLFAYSTIISWSYYGERCFVYLFGDRASTIYKLLYILVVFLGSIVAATKVLEFGDMMILVMGVPNILGLLLLSGKVRRALDEYMGKLQRGEMPIYTKAGKAS